MSMQVLLYMQAYAQRPVGKQAQDLLKALYAQTAIATQHRTYVYLRASLELQLNRVQDAQHTIALFDEGVGDIPPPCWLLHYRILFRWIEGDVNKVPL